MAKARGLKRLFHGDFPFRYALREPYQYLGNSTLLGMAVSDSEKDLGFGETARAFYAATITIAIGQTTSTAIDFRRWSTAALVVPAGFAGSSLTFMVSADNITYAALSDATGTAVPFPVTASRSYSLPASLEPWHYFQIVSNATATGIETLTVCMKA